jgi:hypothetical protein
MTWRRIGIGALGVVAAAVFAVSAAAKEETDTPRWRRTYADALLEARLRNAPVLVSRHKDGCGRCVRMHEAVFANKDFIRWSHEAVVMLVAHNELGHEEKKETDSYGNPVKRCTLYPGLSCFEHLDVAVDIDNARGDGLVKVPFLELCPNTWLVLPTGEVKQVSEADQFTAGKIRAQVETLQKDLGAVVPTKGFAALKELAKSADAALDEDKHREALTHLAALGKALAKPHAGLREFIAVRVATVERSVGYDFENVRDDADLKPAAKREQITKLLEVVNVEVLGARPPCHAAMKAWLDAK